MCPLLTFCAGTMPSRVRSRSLRTPMPRSLARRLAALVRWSVPPEKLDVGSIVPPLPALEDTLEDPAPNVATKGSGADIQSPSRSV